MAQAIFFALAGCHLILKYVEHTLLAADRARVQTCATEAGEQSRGLMDAQNGTVSIKSRKFAIISIKRIEKGDE